MCYWHLLLHLVHIHLLIHQYLSGLLNALNKVDVAREFDMDPITKVEKIAKFCPDLDESPLKLLVSILVVHK